MPEHLLKRAVELLAKGEVFAMATVVRCKAPSSGKPGDKAIILADGNLSGWIGGGCAQPVVIREAMRALADGQPRLICIRPESNEPSNRQAPSKSEEPSKRERQGIVDYTMTCYSGGELDIYIEPVLPNLHLVILGRSPVAETLARLAHDVGYTVSAVTAATNVDHDDEDRAGFAGVGADIDIIRARDFDLSRIRITQWTYLVVSTQGEGDEEALEHALRALGAEAPYLAFVASKTKAEKVIDSLRHKGIVEEKLRLVRAPAGLHLGAASPEEIAVSILAEIVQVHSAHRRSGQHESPAGDATSVNTEARDPICGMTVDIKNAVYKLEHQGTWFYFCCAGCKHKFETMTCP